MSMTQRFALVAGIALTGVLFAHPCRAQDALFGNAGAVPAAAARSSEADEDDDKPIVRQLLEHSRRGPVQMGTAISSLARIGRWSDVDRLLSQLPAKNYDSQAQAELSGQIGPAIYLRMKESKQLSAPALAALDKLAQAAVSEAESPQRLRAAIANLSSDSTDNQLAAARLLFGGGNAAVSELVTAAVSEDRPAVRDDMLRVMLQLGGGGDEALRQLALYGTAPVRQRAIASLARISRKAYLADLLTAAYAADASDQERATARANLQRLPSGIPDRDSAAEILMIDFEDKQGKARLANNDDQPTTLWSVNADRTGVTHQPTLVIYSVYRDAVDAGARLRRLGAISPQLESEILATNMAYRVMIDPDWGDPDQIASIRTAFPKAADTAAISAAIGKMLEQDDHAATVGLIRLIDVENPSVLDRSLLLQGDGVLSAPLVRAASSAHPQVRYEAALAAARLARGAAYSGSSMVMRTLSEMRSLTDKPTAVLVETRPDVVIGLEQILADLGYRVEVVGDASQLQRVVARGGDLRLILSKTELADATAIEMIDLVRRIERGRLVPIAFYGSEPARLESDRWQAPAVLIGRPASAAGLDGLMQTVNRQRRLPPLSEIDRQSYRRAATNLLETPAAS